MPLCALVGERILCMHGGISPNLKNLDQLRIIQRPCAARNASLEKDLLWADPMPGITGFRPNMRGASFEFGADVLELACKQLNVDLVDILKIAFSSYNFITLVWTAVLADLSH